MGYLAACLIALTILGGRWGLALLLVPVVFAEVYIGNIDLFLALAVPAGLVFPPAWILLAVTKFTPAVIVLWFAARGEWRSFLLVVAGTAFVVLPSVITTPDLWTGWFRSSTQFAGSAYGASEIPILPRLVAAAVLVVVGARRDWRWTLAVGATLAMPGLDLKTSSIFLSILPLYGLGVAADWPLITRRLRGRARRHGSGALMTTPSPAEDRAQPARHPARLLSWLPLYPPFLAIAWVVAIFTERSIDPAATGRTIVFATLLALVVSVGFRVMTGSAPLAGGLSIVVLMALVAAGTAAEVAALILAGVLLTGVYALDRRRGERIPWRTAHRFATAAAAGVLALQLSGYGWTIWSRPAVTFDTAWSEPASVDARPNIYVVIADGHGRADVLREAYGYDPAKFVARLKKLGFAVAGASRTNYLNTPQSLASLFDGAHLNPTGLPTTDTPLAPFLASALTRNPTEDLLDRLGYRVAVVPSGFDHVAERHADNVIDTGQLSELEWAVVESTAAKAWFPRSVTAAWLSSVGDRTRAQLELLPRLAAPGGSPQAVFMHLPLPHPPYVFNADCSVRAADRLTFQTIDPSGPDVVETLSIAGSQTACVDGLLATSLADLVAADPSAVVIVLSDHGPDVRFDWGAPGGPGLADREANFFAARTPGETDVFPNDITLVNVLPRLFNAYFGMNIPLSTDDTYYQPHKGGPLAIAPRT